MIYRWLAGAVAVFHLLVCAFFLFGGLLCFAYPWLVFVHLPLALWVSAAFTFGWTCPLTPVENWLWRLAGAEGYDEGFVERYIFRPLGVGGGEKPLPERKRRNDFFLGLIFLSLTLLVHGANWPTYHRWLIAEKIKPEVTGRNHEP